VVVDGKAVIGRKTRWGAVVVEDENHCEFIHLRNFLTRTHLQDLVETTAMIHYENFRANQLMALKDSVANDHQHLETDPQRKDSNHTTGSSTVPVK
jgi:septin 3/9/12